MINFLETHVILLRSTYFNGVVSGKTMSLGGMGHLHVVFVNNCVNFQHSQRIKVFDYNVFLSILITISGTHLLILMFYSPERNLCFSEE